MRINLQVTHIFSNRKHNKGMSSSVGKGFLVLTISGLLCKIIGAFFRLPLTYILGVEGIGVFQLVMSVYSFVLVLSSGGISVTLSKLISSSRAQGKFGQVKWHIYLAITYCTVISFFLGLVFLFFSKQISLFQQAQSSRLSYTFFLPLLLFSSLVTLFRGVYQGYENMTPTAISQIVEQVCKFVFGLLFAFILSKGSLEGGVFGAFLGILTGEVLAFIYLILSKRKLKLNKYVTTRTGRKGFYSYLVPATLGLAISSFVHFFDSMVVVNRLTAAGLSSSVATSLFGIQSGVVGAILNVPIIISLSLSTSLLPCLSFESSKEKRDNSLKNSFSFLWFAILPITFGILAISLPLYQVAYPMFDKTMFVCAVRLTAIGSVSTIFTALMQYFTSILQSKGEFKFVMIAMSVGGMLKILCTIFLCSVREINILGIAIGNAVFSIVVVVLCFVRLKNKTFVTLDNFFVPLLSSLVMLVLTSFLSSILFVSPVLKLLISVSFGCVIYILLTLPLVIKFKREFGWVKHN